MRKNYCGSLRRWYVVGRRTSSDLNVNISPARTAINQQDSEEAHLNMAEQNNKLKTLDIDTSSQESKFHIDGHHNQFRSIDSQPMQQSNARSEMADSVLNRVDAYGRTGMTMGKAAGTGTIEVPDQSDNREGGFSSISNVRSKNYNALPPRPANDGASIPQFKLKLTGKEDLNLNNQCSVDSARGSNLGKSSRLSQDFGKVNMQEYDTIKQMESVEAKREMQVTPRQVDPEERKSNCLSNRQSDQALAEALRQSRSNEKLAMNTEDDIVAKMALEMQQLNANGAVNDVNLMDEEKANQSHNARPASKPASPSKIMAQQMRMKKMKGNLGLAIQHGTDMADAIQLEANIMREESEEEIFADNGPDQQPENKVKDEDDFGMSSDDEDALNRRKRDQKKKEAEKRRVQQEEEAQRILEEQKALTRKAEELKARFEAGSLTNNKLRIKTDGIRAPGEPSTVVGGSPSKKAATNSQVMSFEDEQNDSLIQVPFQNDSGLTPVIEQYDETTEANIQKKYKSEFKDFSTSPNALQSLRSDSKMLAVDKITGNESSQANEPDKSQILNIDDSHKAIQDSQKVQKEEVKQTKKARPNFLGRLGAMIGLMQKSNFADQHEEDGRLGSAPSPKNGEDDASRTKANQPYEVAAKADQSLPPQPAGEQARPESSHSKQSNTKSDGVPSSSKNESRQVSRRSSNRKSRHSNQKGPSEKPEEPPQEQDQLISIEKQDQSELEAEKVGKEIAFEPSATNIVLRTTQTAEVAKKKKPNVLEELKQPPVLTPKSSHGKKPQNAGESASQALNMNERQKRQQARILKAAQEGKDLNESYYDEVESDSQQQEQEAIDPYDINHKHGYESSSTAHREKSTAATRLKQKLAQFQQEEVVESKVAPNLAHSHYVDPNKDDTNILFATKKEQFQNQGIMLRKGDYNQLHPHSGKQAIVDTLRFAGCFIYLTDLCLKIAYYENTKWISSEIRDIWKQVFTVRPLFILFYHAWFVVFSFFRSYYEYSQERKKPNYSQIHADPNVPSNPDNIDQLNTDANDCADENKEERLKEYKRMLARTTLQRLCEIVTQALVLPVTMYTGFARLAALREIKTNYLYICLGQELIMHQVPLSLLYHYNQSLMDKPEYSLDTAVKYISILHTFWLLFEICMFRSYLNKGINLEQRIKQQADIRIKDLLRLGFIAGLIGCMFTFPAYMAFEKQVCKGNFYAVGDFECRNCFDYHGDECLECIDDTQCKTCVAGHYIHNSTCHTCASYWPGCVDCIYNSKTESEKGFGQPILNTLDLNPVGPNFRNLQVLSNDLDGDGYSGGKLGDDVVSKLVYDPVTDRTTTEYFEVSKCLKPAHGFYFDKNNQVVSCKTLENCEIDACGQQGCERCKDGYYLTEQGTCNKCELVGCAKCSSATQCIECTSDFLSVQDDGSCGCNIDDGVFEHMSKDRYGSCVCDEGYWLTEFGCMTCEQLIPGCQTCYRTSANTLIPLYEGANVGRFSRQYYVDCRTCPYHDYRLRANVASGDKPACIPCSEKWEGCGYCGTYGNRCTSCLESHVYQSRNYYQPCRPCWCWMGNCIWCRGSNQCVKRWEPGMDWPEYDISCD